MNDTNCVMVILNYNDSERAVSLAEKCIAFSMIDRIIIVDNKSTDNSIDTLNRVADDRIRIVCSEYNKGFAAGNNLGAKYAIKEYHPAYLLFANTDTIFSDQEVCACINVLEQNEKLGLISMRIKNIKGDEERSAWKYRSFLQYFLMNFWLYRHFKYASDRYAFNDKIQLVDMVRGSYMMFRANALQEVNYFDEGTFLYYEEECISYRLKQAGFKVGILTDHFYIHNHIYAKNAKNNELKNIMDRSLIYFLGKYYQISDYKLRIFYYATKISSLEMNLINFAKKYINERKESSS